MIHHDPWARGTESDGKKDNFEFATWVVRAIVPPLMLLIGIPGNLLTLMILLRQQGSYVAVFLRAILIFNVLALLAMAIPEIIITVTDTVPSLYSIHVCHTIGLLEVSTIGTSIWLGALIPSVRIFYMISPVKARRLFTHKNSVIIVFAIVVLLVATEAFIAGLTMTAQITSKDEGTITTCIVHEEGDWLAALVGIIPCYVLPMILLIVVNTLLYVCYKRKSTEGGPEKGSLTFIEKRHTAYLVLIHDIHFFVTLGPHLLFHVFGPLIFNENVLWQWRLTKILHLISEIFMYISFSTNYFVLVCLGKRFRLDLKQTMRSISYSRSRRSFVSDNDFGRSGSNHLEPRPPEEDEHSYMPRPPEICVSGCTEDPSNIRLSLHDQTYQEHQIKWMQTTPVTSGVRSPLPTSVD